MQKDNKFHKIGLFGTTIKDASNKIKKLSDIIEWLEDMDNLYKNGSKKHWWGTDTSSEKGMKCLHDSITKNKLTDVKENSFSSLTNLVVILHDISIGSLKAWRGRTKQPGFQKTLLTCNKTITNVLTEFPINNIKSAAEFGFVKKHICYLVTKIKEGLNAMMSKPNPRAYFMEVIEEGIIKEWSDTDKSLLDTNSINKIVEEYKNAFELNKETVRYLKDILLLAHADYKFLELDDKFEGDKSFKNIISWMLNLYKKACKILNQVRDLKKGGGLPDEPTSYSWKGPVWEKVNEWEIIKEKLKPDKMNELKTAFDNKTYLKYLWDIRDVLSRLSPYLKSAKDLLGFTEDTMKKIWNDIKGNGTLTALPKEIISIICKELHINNDGSQVEGNHSGYFRYADLEQYEKSLTKEIERVLNDNQKSVPNDEQAIDLIKRFNENYDKKPLIDIDKYISK